MSLLLLTASCEVKKQIDTNTDGGTVASLALQGVSDSLVKADSMYVCSINMFERIHRETKGNVVFSPLGIEALFRMLQDGASGSTASELQQVLGVSSEEISGIMHDLQDNGRERHSYVHWADVRMANLVAVDKACRLRNDYRDNVCSKYGAEIMHLNFGRSQSVEIINNWVKEHTNGKIPSIVEQLPSKAMMCAVNALYFKGTWNYRFKKEKTKEKAFYQYDGKKTTVAMMRQEERHYYTHNDTMQVVAMGYEPRCSNSEKQRNFSMLVMLPRKDKTIDDVITYLHHHDIAEIRKSMSRPTVNLQLPRFSTEIEINVMSILQSLGMHPLNEFSGISPDNIFLTDAIQRSKIDVDEHGTEAAAATAAIAVGSAWIQQEQVCNFIANRPFIYMIVDDETNTIYFMGQYTEGTINDGETWVSREYTGEEEKEEPLSYVRDNGEPEVLKAKEVIATEPVRPRPGIYDVVEQMPSFPGGQAKLMEFIEKNMRYPQLAREKQIQGRVILQFIVSEKGKISDIKVAKKIDPLLDQEAVRIVRSMPRWNPGRQAGQPVKVRYTLPITFRLEGIDEPWYFRNVKWR